jgi:hypothetical protein
MRKSLLLFLFAASFVYADGLTDLEQSCLRANFGNGKYWLIQCLQEVFTAYPAHLTIGTIAPGAGTVALGPNFARVLPMNNADLILSTEALVSTDTSWLVQTQAVYAFPPLGQTTLASSSRMGRRDGLSAKGLAKESELDAQATATLRARMFDAKEQWYYGLGPATSLGGDSKYSQKQFELRAAFNNPFTAWTAGGVNLDFLRPRIVDPNSGIPIQTLYNDTTAPGLDSKDEFVRFEPYLSFRLPPRRSFNTAGRVGFSFYRAAGDPRFSFRRLSVSDITSVPLRIPLHPARTADKRGALANFLCPSVRSGEHCSAGDLSLNGRMDATFTATGSQAPFFFDPTLGGQDFYGNDTLRGFGDYRFRGPNRILLKAEYRHPIWAIFGLVVFYDVGKVGVRPSDLALGQLRHDIGLGVDISVGNHQVARLYAAFGTGEPVQIQPRFGSLL